MPCWQDNPDGLWVVDPSTGTTNFVNGLPYFAISVALMVRGVSELEVIGGVGRNVLCPSRPGCLAQRPSPALENHRNSMGDAIAAVEVKYLRSGKLAAHA